MPQFRDNRWLLVPVVLLVVIYYPGLTTWFYQDDFGWLNLRHDVHFVRDLAAALFAPKAHGNMRPLGENAYWLGLGAIFGSNPLPFHLLAFVVQSVNLLLLGLIVRRLIDWPVAAPIAQVLWLLSAGVAESMGWSSIFNQILSAFFFLLAFQFLLRSLETGRRADTIGHWAAFVLGLGALEINVVYPAIASAYCLLYARPHLRRVLPMFAVSLAAVWIHFHFAPPPEAGVYAPRVDASVFGTLWTYWHWALGPLPFAVAVAIALGAAAGAVILALRGRYAMLLGAAWFLLPLVPYLPLPLHKMDYYLAVPAIGVAMMGAAALAAFRNSALPVRAITAALVLLPTGASAAHSWTITNWQHARGERVEDLVLGVEEIRAAHPNQMILLDGVDDELFWSGIADLPFRARSVPYVYLAPGSERGIQAPPHVAARYCLPEGIAGRALAERRAVVYRMDGGVLRDTTARSLGRWQPGPPRFINLGDPVFADSLGDGWPPAESGTRALRHTGVVRIAAPKQPDESLYLGIFCTTSFTPVVRIDGVAANAARIAQSNGLSEFRITLPRASAPSREVLDPARSPDRSRDRQEAVAQDAHTVQALGAHLLNSIEVEIRNPLSEPLVFGYAEVR
jgi:hypothetical protein